MELLGRELKLEKELREQSLKENKSPKKPETPQPKRKKSLMHEISDLFNESPDVSLIESNCSNGSLNMGIKNESIEDSFIACSQVQSPIKRTNRIKKEVKSPLSENRTVLDIPKRTKWISKANLENSIRKSSTPEKTFLKPKFEPKTIFSTKMKQQTLEQMTNKNTTVSKKPDVYDDDSLNATYCPEVDAQLPIRKSNDLFAFTQVKNAAKTVPKVEPSSSKPKVKNIIAESKFKTKSPNKSDSSCYFMPPEVQNVIVIDESQSGDEEHFSSKSDGVLTKAEKACLKEYEKDEYRNDCPDCALYMKYIRGEIKDNKPVDECSKHRQNFDTPEGFWDPFFPPTAEVHRDTLVDNRFIGLKD